MAPKAKKTPKPSVNTSRHDQSLDPDCEIVSVTPRKGAAKKQQPRSQQSTAKARNSQKNRKKNNNNTKSPRKTNNASTVQRRRRDGSTSAPASAARTASTILASAPPTASRSARLPLITPVQPVGATRVDYVDLTECLSSEEESDVSEDEDDDDDYDENDVQVIDADVFKKAATRRATPKLFKQRTGRQPPAAVPARATTPIVLESSSESDSESDSYGRGDYKVDDSPSRRYARRRRDAGKKKNNRTLTAFERSPAPSPEETAEEARRHGRASTLPPLASRQLSKTNQDDGEGIQSHDARLEKVNSTHPQPTNDISRVKQHTACRIESPILPSVRSEPPRRRKSDKVKDANRDIQPVSQTTTNHQRSSSVPPPRDAARFVAPLKKTTDTPSKQVKKKTPAKAGSNPKSHPTPIPSQASKSKEKAPSPIKPVTKNDVNTSINADIDHQESPSESSSDQSSSPLRDDAVEARTLPPPQAYGFSNAIRPTIDRLKQRIRDGRVSIPPVKQELRVTRAGHEAISTEMKRRGVTSTASYNGVLASLMREYSRLLYRSPVSHLSTMTTLMNDLQDECLEIEARRPAKERSVLIKKEGGRRGVDLNKIFSTPNNNSNSDSDSDSNSSDESSSDDSDESEDEDVGLWSSRVNRIKTEDGKQVIIKKEEDPKPVTIKKETTTPIMVKREGTKSIKIKRERSTPAVIKKEPVPQSPIPCSKRTFSTTLKSRPVTMVSRGTQTDNDVTPTRKIDKKKRGPDEETGVSTPQGSNYKRQRTYARQLVKGNMARVMATPRTTPWTGKKLQTASKKAGKQVHSYE